MRTTPPRPSAVIAGTALAAPHALWHAWQHPPPEALSAAAVALPAVLYWTAAPGQPVPAGWVFWLPTPSHASPAERALEQDCRSQLMQATMAGTTQLQVLYGAPHHQMRALRDCLAAWSAVTAAKPASPETSPSAPSDGSSSPHGHAPGLRCRECLDPASEQRLFSRLLAAPAPGPAP